MCWGRVGGVECGAVQTESTGRDAVPGCDVVMWVGRDPGGGWGRSARVWTGLQKVVKLGGGWVWVVVERGVVGGSVCLVWWFEVGVFVVGGLLGSSCCRVVESSDYRVSRFPNSKITKKKKKKSKKWSPRRGSNPRPQP